MKTLIIAEKPSVASDIVSALTSQLGPFRRGTGMWESESVIVSNAIGHLVEIDSETAAPRGAPLPIIPNFTFKPIDRTFDQFKVLKGLISNPNVGTIINACDAGREGELIFRLIVQAASGSRAVSKTVKRMWLQSMTPQAIRDAYASMRTDAQMQPLAQAAYSRMEADWLVGINSSRALSQMNRSSTSAGRVQTPTLAILVHRQIEILNFSPSNFWEIHGSFGVQAGIYVGKYQNPKPAVGDPVERISDKATAEAIVAKCSGHDPLSVTEETKPSSKAAPRLFDLTTLQREANRRFGLSATETLAIAQSLYEKHKVLTYPRTSSNALPDDYVPTATSTMQALAKSNAFAVHADRVLDSGWIKPDTKIFDSGKVTDHFAIVPTGVLPQQLNQDEAAIFEMVTKRFIAVFHPAAQYMDTVRITVVQDERFKSTGRVLVSEGWLAVYGADLEQEDDSEEKQPALRAYVQGERVSTKEMALKALKTKPKKPFTENTLLSAMEHAGRLVDDDQLASAMKDLGLGTPATRASIIERLLAAKEGQEAYVIRDKKNLIPTPRGIALITMLEKSKVESLVSPIMTGDWEYKLLKMERGQFNRTDFMTEIADLTRTIVSTIATTSRANAPTLKAPCPLCKGALAQNGRTIDCACGYKLWTSMASRPFKPDEIETLLSTGSVGPLSGFIGSKPGSKPFSASVKLDQDGKPTFNFEAPPVESLPTMACKCPKCAKPLHMGFKTVECGCGFRLWKTIANKTLTDNQLTKLIMTGQLPRLEGFVSKAGKKFGAALTLEPTGSVKFQFD